MSKKTRHDILLLGTISYLTEGFYKLSPLARVDLFAKWQNPNFPVLNDIQSNAISSEHEQIKDMIHAWNKLAKRVNLTPYGSKLQDFRIKLEKIIFSDLKALPLDSKLAFAKAVSLALSRGGCYQEDRPLTTPDPQRVKDINAVVDALKYAQLNKYLSTFSNFTLRTQAKIIKMFNSAISGIRRSTSWVFKAKRLLAEMKDERYKTQFIEALFKAHQQKVQGTFIDRPKKTLLTRFHLPAAREAVAVPKHPSKRLFASRI